MEFLEMFDAKSPLPSDFPSREPSLSVASDTTSRASKAKSGFPLNSSPVFTKQPRDMVQRFLEITASRPSNVLKKHGRRGGAKASSFMEEFLLRNKTNGVEKTQPKTKKKTDFDFIRRPILVEKHSSDEDLLPTKTEEGKKRSSCLVTLQRAKYRERVAREKQRIEDTKKEFEKIAEAEVMEKRKTKLSLQPTPKIRSTRGSQLRERVLNGSESKPPPPQQQQRQKHEEVTTDTSTRTSMAMKRRKCSLRIRAPPPAPPVASLTCRLKRFNRRSCNPWLDHDTVERSERDLRITGPERRTSSKSHQRRSRDDAARATPHATHATTTSRSFWKEILVHIRVNGGGSRPPFK